jgi:hypothetical protein
MHGSEAAYLSPSRKKLCIGQERYGIETVRLHGREHARKLVETRNDEQTKLQPKFGTNRPKVVPQKAMQ